MDKNMINIDDLVRLRLAGGEEKERPGAWLAMKDLLDKEMPVAVATGYNWRKTLVAAAVVLMVGAASIGGYKLFTNMNSTGDSNGGNTQVNTSSNTIVANHPASKAEGGTNVGGGKSSPDGNNKNNQRVAAVAATTSQGNNSSDNTVGNGGKVSDNHNVSNSSSKESKIGRSNHAALNNESANDGNEGVVSSNALKNNKKNHSNNVLASSGKLPSKEVASETHRHVNNGNTQNGLAKGNKKDNKNKGTAPDNTITKANVPAPPVYNYGGNANAPVANTVPPVKRERLDYHKTNPRYVDSAAYTFVHEKVRKGVFRTDTIDKGYMALGNNELNSENSNTIAPAAATDASMDNAASANAEEKEVKLTRRELRRAGKGSYIESSLWEKMVANVKPDLSQMSFHPGLMAGVSSTVGKYNMFGIQGGVSGTFNFNERWGILAELKALYRFGNGKSLQNDYNSFNGDRQFISANYYKFRVDSQEHSFNITSSGLIELPLALRYTTQRLNFFGGANFAYNFAVNVEERYGKVYTTDHYGNNSKGEELAENWKNNNDPRLTPAEFGSRFSIGYMAGVGYQVTPLVGLDLRASQVFWDNGKVHSAGAYLVSKEMYRAPCFQFNVTYRLQGRKNGPMRAR